MTYRSWVDSRIRLSLVGLAGRATLSTPLQSQVMAVLESLVVQQSGKFRQKAGTELAVRPGRRPEAVVVERRGASMRLESMAVGRVWLGLTGRQLVLYSEAVAAAAVATTWGATVTAARVVALVFVKMSRPTQGLAEPQVFRPLLMD